MSFDILGFQAARDTVFEVDTRERATVESVFADVVAARRNVDVFDILTVSERVIAYTFDVGEVDHLDHFVVRERVVAYRGDMDGGHDARIVVDDRGGYGELFRGVGRKIGNERISGFAVNVVDGFAVRVYVALQDRAARVSVLRIVVVEIEYVELVIARDTDLAQIGDVDERALFDGLYARRNDQSADFRTAFEREGSDRAHAVHYVNIFLVE